MGRLCVTALGFCLLVVASCTTGPAQAPSEGTVLNVFPGPPPPPPYQPVPADSPVERVALPADQAAAAGSGPLPSQPGSDAPQVAIAPPQAGVQQSTQAQGQTYQPSTTYQPQPTYQPSYQPSIPSVGPCAENGSCYGDISNLTGKPKTVAVRGYYRKNGTYVRGHYRSH